MITTSIIPEKIKSFDYYKNKLPLYLQNSFGFIEHFRIWHQLLVGNAERQGIVGNADVLLNLLRIFDNDYPEYLTTIEDVTLDGFECDILDKLGNIFGVTRYFKLTLAQEEQIVLNNRDFLVLIKAQIIKNYCDGTTEQLNEYYRTIGLQIYIQNVSTPATANLYLVTSSGETIYSYSENVKKMFLAGFLEIESMGIQYNRSFIDLGSILFWDVLNEDKDNGWDGGNWVI